MNTIHLDDEQIQRRLAGELAATSDAVVRRHLADCADCRDRVSAAERDAEEIEALLRLVDHPAPPVRAQAIAERASRERSPAWVRWAAGILLVLGLAGVASAIPGSPLRGWIGSVVELITPFEGPSDAAAPSPPAPARTSTDEPAAGIAVVPGRLLVIQFMAAGNDARASVSLTDGRPVVVQAPPGAVTFTSDVDRLVVDNREAPPGASFEIRIPRTAPRVEIRVPAGRIFLMESGRILTPGVVDSAGSYRLPLRPPGR